MPYVNGTYYKTQKEGMKAEKEKRLAAGKAAGSGSSGSSASSSSNKSSSSSTWSSSQSSTRPSSGGSSYTASSTQYSGGSSASRDYHQEAKDAAARGDWSAVTRALAARQEKINAQGGNDRGTSNAQILQNLQNQYRNSYNALSSTDQGKLSSAASGQYNSKGWEEGHDYLAEAQNYARAGDMEAAYDALRRRGFKMADTGSLGGGTSQDQAYALIQGLYDHSPGAASSYQSQLAANQRRLQEHPTQFGTGTNPSLANKHFVSEDGQYIIYYDSSGTPFKAQPNNGQYSSTKYTPEYKALMEQYYGGTDDYADLRRQMHNLDVVHSGNGRLIDQDWNWASGEALPVRDAYQYWQDADNDVYWNRNTGQDKNALAGILANINRGQTYQTPQTVPLAPMSGGYDDLGGGVGSGAYSPGGGGGSPSGGGGNELTASSVQYGDYMGSDLTQYIRDMYQQSLAAQLAALQSGFEQNKAQIEYQNSLIGRNYQDQMNQAAAQSDLQRMYLAELGNYQGLNTGASGQLAMAQGMALQNNLASLGAAQNQDLAANGLALSQLQFGYLGDVASAQAQNAAQMSGALYDEYVRQIQAAEAARAAAQAQANWQAQFDYQMQQDALSQQYQQQAAELEYRQQLAQLEAAAGKQSASNAWDYAQLLLKNGVMPDEATLYAAGLDATSAQSLADSYKWQLSQKYASKSSGGSSGGSSPSSGGSSKPRLTYSQALAAIENGQTSDAAIKAYDYYMGSGAYDQYFGDAGAAGTRGASGNIGTYIQGINNALTNGNTVAADGYLRSIWPNLSEGEKQQMQSVLARYGIRYTP